MIDPALLADAPDRLLAVATDLLLSGDAARGGEYLGLLDRARPSVVPDSELAARLAAARSLHHMLTGRVDEAAAEALAVRAIQERTQLAGEWNAAVPLILLRVYPWLEDYEAVEREAAAALAAPQLSEPVKLVMVPGPLALAWFEAGRLAEAAAAASAAEKEARRLGLGQHFSPRIICWCWPAWRWSGATSTPPSSSPSRCYRSPGGGGRCLSSSRCLTRPLSGPAAGKSATRWPASKRHDGFWPGPDRCC